MFGKPVFLCFSLSGKGFRVRKVGEGKGKTICMELFGLLSDRFLGLLHGFKLMDSRFRSTTVLYSVALCKVDDFQ